MPGGDTWNRRVFSALLGVALATLACGSASSGAATERNERNLSPCVSCGGVIDQNGKPVAGVTVTLTVATSPSGPFSQVPSDSKILAPTTRTNPQITSTPGSFGWGVEDGNYQVVAQKAGCHAPGNAAQLAVTSEVLTVPPGHSGIKLEVVCGPTTSGDSGGSGGGGSGGSGGGGSGGGGGSPSGPSTTLVVSLGCSAFGAPLRARAQGSELSVATTIQTSKLSSVALSATDASGEPLVLLPGTRIGDARLSSSDASANSTAQANRELPVVARFAAGAGTASGRLTLIASDGSGASTPLTLPFVSTATAPRMLVSRCGAGGLRARLVGKTIDISGSVALDEPARLALDASYRGRDLPFAKGSSLGTRTFHKALARLSALAAVGTTPFRVTLPRPAASTARLLVRMTAVDARGKRTVLVLRFAG